MANISVFKKYTRTSLFLTVDLLTGEFMPDKLFVELVEKMLEAPELTAKIEAPKLDKIKKLLTGAKLPKPEDLATALGDSAA